MNKSKTTVVKQKSRYRSGACAVAMGALLLAGCASFAPATPEQIVQQRANSYWKARMAGQVDKAYAFSTPSYRKLRNEAQFKREFGTGVSVEGAEVTKVVCKTEKCIARIRLDVKPALAGLKIGAIANYMDETWVSEDGQWWRYQDF